MMERRCLILICFIYSQVGLEEISAINNTHFVNAPEEGLFTKTTTNASRQSSVRDVKLNGTKLQTVIASDKHGTTTALLKSSSLLVTVIPSLQKTKQSSVNFVHPFTNKSSTRKEMVQSHSRLESTFSPSSTSPPQSSSLLDAISMNHHQIQTTSSSIQATQATSHLQNISLSRTEKTTDKLHSRLETPSHTQIAASPANSTYVSSILRETNITIPFVQIIRGSFTSFIKLSATIMNKGKITPSLSFNIKHSPIEAMTSSRAIKLKTSSSISLHPGNTSIYANKSHSSLKKVTSDINSPQPSVSLENSTTLAYTSSSTSKFIQDDSPSSRNTKYSSSVNFVNKISLKPTSYETKILASSTTTTSSLVASTKTQSLSFEINTEIFKLLSTSLITPVKMETGDRMMKSSIYPMKTAAADGNVDSKKKKGENQGLPAWIAILSSIAVFIAIMTIVVVTCKYIRWNKDHGDYTLWISNLELQPITSRNAEVLT